jgi:cytoskeletal protein RodZ
VSEADTTNDSTATSPGTILKRCREYHEISLEEAAEATKIAENYLVALEEGQLKSFASLAYLKGFLRIYANYLGLNPDDMIRVYEKQYGERPRTDRPQDASGISSPPRRKFPLQKLAMPLFFLILILITAAIVNRSSPPRPPPVAPSASITPSPAPAIQRARTSAGNTRVTKTTVEAVSDTQRTETPGSVTGDTGKKTTEASRGFVVRMKVTQSGTLTVTIDGAASQAHELVVGDSIEWKAERSITLELSNAGGVEAELNGRQLKPFGQAGKPAVIVLDAEGARQ